MMMCSACALSACSNSGTPCPGFQEGGGAPLSHSKHSSFDPLGTGDQADRQYAMCTEHLSRHQRQRDPASALPFCAKAAQAGNSAAQALLGEMYCQGLGVAADCNVGAQWLHRAAAAGNGRAQNGLAALYYHGHGTSQDFRKAWFWSMQAALQGMVDAQARLGFMYLAGNGVDRDLVQALIWITIAAASGDTSVLKAQRMLSEELTPEELGLVHGEGQRLRAAIQARPQDAGGNAPLVRLAPPTSSSQL